MKRHTVLLALLAIPILSCNETKESSVTKAPRMTNLFDTTEFIDLTHAFSNETVYWVTAKEFELDTVAYGNVEAGYFYSANNFSAAEHGGTHIDAPIHFAKGKQTVDEIPIDKLIGKAIKIDVRKNAENNKDYQITIADFQNWETENGIRIPDNSIILLETGYSRFYPNKLTYLGTEARGAEAVKDLHFPGLSSEAAEWLTTKRSIKAIGLDTASIDYGQSKDFKSHVILLSKDIPVFENLANLEGLPSKGFMVIALPIKIKGGSGGPLRIVAVVNNKDVNN